MNFNLMYILEGVVIASLLLLKGLMWRWEADHRQTQIQECRTLSIAAVHPNYPSIRKAYKFTFERILFIVTFLNMFIILFSLANEFMLEAPYYYVLSNEVNILLGFFAMFILLAFLSLVIFNGFFPHLRIFPMFMHKKYPIYYIFFNAIFIMVIITFYQNSTAPYILGAMLVINVVVLAIWQPYP
jgi:hypothetical protein